MSFLKKLATSLSGSDTESYENGYDEFEPENDAEDEEEEPKRPAPEKRAEPRQEQKVEQRKPQDKYQPHPYEQAQQPRQYQPAGRASIEMKLVQPKNQYQSCYAIGDYIMRGCTVIINFEDTSTEMETKILDFIHGLCFATGAKIKESSSKTLIVSPVNVRVSSDQGEDEAAAEQE